MYVNQAFVPDARPSCLCGFLDICNPLLAYTNGTVSQRARPLTIAQYFVDDAVPVIKTGHRIDKLVPFQSFIELGWIAKALEILEPLWHDQGDLAKEWHHCKTMLKTCNGLLWQFRDRHFSDKREFGVAKLLLALNSGGVSAVQHALDVDVECGPGQEHWFRFSVTSFGREEDIQSSLLISEISRRGSSCVVIPGRSLQHHIFSSDHDGLRAEQLAVHHVADLSRQIEESSAAGCGHRHSQ